MRRHGPVIKTALAAFASLLLVASIHAESVFEARPSSMVPWLALGLLYTQLVEYAWHRFPMHRPMPLLRQVRRNHLEHHRIFYGERFQVRSGWELGHIAGRPWAFPILFFAHYVVLVGWLPPAELVAFLLGAVLHYVVFELTHWLTHLEDNALDRLIARIPLVSEIRAYQIEHHRWHHEVPELAFNFNPPYLGDRLFGHMPEGEPAEILAPAEGPPVAPEPEPEGAVTGRPWARPLFHYGALAALGVAALSVLVLAHGAWSDGRRDAPTEHSL